jgi:hypothetical protein
MNDLSRKKFLRTIGSMVAGGAVVGVSGALITRKSIAPVFLDSAAGSAYLSETKAFVSPYKRVSSFAIPHDVKAFEQYADRLYVAVTNEVMVFDYYGKLLHRFPAGEVIRDMAVGEEGIFLLYPARVEVYTQEGKPLMEWEACSELSNYCSLALAPGCVFVTDMANKNICKYTSEGAFVKFITSPDAFIIPSLTFGIVHANDRIYCSNSGRHQVECYTLSGEYAGAFGCPGGAPGLFAGCCNPVHLAYTANGEIITSEKGNPRISCYGSDGTFRSLLLDSNLLGGGHAAYDVKVWEDRLFIAGRDKVSVFRYDKRLSNATACGGCDVVCPLRKDIMS